MSDRALDIALVLLLLHHREPFNPTSITASPTKNNGKPMNTRKTDMASIHPVRASPNPDRDHDDSPQEVQN